MMESRPNPDELLARIKQQEAKASKGKLKIFLGAAAGVGKTYKMLESARELRNQAVDVVAGCVVTHKRKETEALLVGIEQLPLKTIEYQHTQLEEFDLDAALKRDPQVLLVDELAHTNIPGCRHEKRWQDVEELLDAGIDVFTTLNIQHLESANDIVAQITDVTIRETVPDSIFEKANEIELVDLPPDELIQRLKEGKVYVPEKSQVALENFFRKGNLIALRELALRSTAERVDKQMQQYRADEFVRDVWPASERLLVCIGPSPLSVKVVRAARRMASGLNAEWMAVYVETPGYMRLPQAARNRLARTLKLAEQLGAEATVLTGTNVAEELVAYAQRRNVTKILIGKPLRPRWREILFGSVVDDVIRKSGEIDVNVITGEGQPAADNYKSTVREIIDSAAYGKALLVVVVATLATSVMFQRFALVNLLMIYQLAVVIVAVGYGRGPAILASILSVAVCDFFFIPPYRSFAVSDTEYLLTLAVMLVVALTLSTLTVTVRQQAEMARQRERRTSALYAMTREQAVALTTDAVLSTSVGHIGEIFNSQTAVCLSNKSGELVVIEGLQGSFEVDAHEFGVAQWVFTHGQTAGAGTSTLPGAKAIYLPLRGTSGAIGVIGILAADSQRLMHPEEMHLLETFVNQTALAVQRARLSELAQK
jgi:two-component system, OmpR family, sensor histidine kinase KdpD